jgi:hypothetical protein
MPKAREPGVLKGGVLKNRASKMPFPAFWGEILCMEQVRNEEKINEIRPSLMTILIS